MVRFNSRQAQWRQIPAQNLHLSVREPAERARWANDTAQSSEVRDKLRRPDLQ
ncbi:hypothetical protein NBRC116598_33960 [Pseudophaeobacter arcticus]|uniref:Uncharacterized protein n=1 Tax=Pseudophaeobacter arcticus TaxID=385492 RepID=A0ABQ0AQ10_9RHOB